MTHGDEVGGSLYALYRGDTRRCKDVSFYDRSFADCLHCLFAQVDFSRGDRQSVYVGLLGDVDHIRLVVFYVCEFSHDCSKLKGISDVSMRNI